MALSKHELTKDEKRKYKSGTATLEGLNQARQQLVHPTESPSLAHDKITILCVRFGNKYGREYVERLRNMIRRNITIPYELVCLTDDQHPIQDVRTIYQTNANYQRGWWHKVHMFDPNLSISGQILYFDLDVVICANIDKLGIPRQDKFMGILDFNRKFYSSWKYLNSSVMSWTHGTQNHIFQQFKQKPGEAQRLQGDQDWIWKLSQNKITFWPKEWIQSYKWEIRSREELQLSNGKRQFKTIQNHLEIHPECCVAVFHGDPNPCVVQDKFVIDHWR